MNANFWLQMHSGVRWLVVLAFIIVLFRYAVGYVRKGNFAALDGKLLSVFSMLTAIQFILGLLLFGLYGMSGIPLRENAVLHAIIMFVAIFVAASTGGRVKRAEGDASKYQTGLVGTLLSALLILLGVTLIGGW